MHFSTFISLCIIKNFILVFVATTNSLNGLQATPEMGMMAIEPTTKLMHIKWCGSQRTRIKRYGLFGTRLTKNRLTYRIFTYPNQPSPSEVDKEISRAFKVWSDVADLSFYQQIFYGATDLSITFEWGYHGDEESFNGRTLAHAFFPPRSEIHFDGAQNWTVRSYQGMNLFQVAVHEIGHALGLTHSDVPSAIMYPHYMHYDPSFTLDQDDIHGIQALYGKKRSMKNDVTRFNCNLRKIDSVLAGPDGMLYVFKGDKYWKIDSNTVLEGYPRLISSDWSGLTGPIDASFTWNRKIIYIFKGSKYWRYNKSFVLETGSPQPLHHGFPGVPGNVDSAHAWNGKIYFFKGSLFWRFDPLRNPPVNHLRYPMPITSRWTLPSDIDASVHHPNSHLYFFKGQLYWKSDKQSDKINRTLYPQVVKHWWNFEC